VLLTLAACSGETPGSAPRTRPAPSVGAKPRIEIIKEEIRRLGAEHPWAGSYTNGCGFDGDILTLAPEAGFEWTYFDCIQFNPVGSGAVIERDGQIELRFSTGAEHRRVSSSGAHFLIVPWGDDRFLVPPERMLDFANDFNDGSLQFGAHNCGEFQRSIANPRPRAEYHSRHRAGKPVVPPEYASMFLDRPMEAHIVAVVGYREVRDGEWAYNAALVRLDVGIDHGAFLGMVLRVQDHPLHNAYTIVELDAASAIAARSKFAQTEPEVGWRLSTDY
jgi:hypothetical protein